MASSNRCIRMPVVPQICSCDASRPRSLASNWSPSADYPFGAKSQYGPTVKSTRHPELYEGCPATINPLPVPLQRDAVSDEDGAPKSLANSARGGKLGTPEEPRV